MNDLLIQRLRERANNPQRVTDDLTGHTPNAPTTPETLASVEAALNIQLPETFRRAYLEVGDGNWGPGYGLLPLIADSYLSSASNVLGHSQAWGESRLIYVAYWGCTVFSVLDTVQDRVGILDVEDDAPEVTWQGSTARWLQTWADGGNLFFPFEEE